jgi:hypothetical protein
LIYVKLLNILSIMNLKTNTSQVLVASQTPQYSRNEIQIITRNRRDTNHNKKYETKLNQTKLNMLKSLR